MSSPGSKSKRPPLWDRKLMIASIFAATFVLFSFMYYIQSKGIIPHADTYSNLPLSGKQPRPTTLLAVGDIMLSRNVSTKIEAVGNANLPFENLNSRLQEADISFGNLECPLSDSTIRIREGLVFRCLITDFSGVINSGFDILSSANNHSFDQGSRNIDFTIDYLNSQGILPVGTGKSDAASSSVAVVERNGIRFGFLGYSYSAHNDGKFTTHSQVNTMDPEKLKSDIAKLKNHADVVIVSMHAGTEYKRHPNQMQIDFAHAAIDAGATAVIGHHPHWVQDIEIYKNKPIFYSLGNFVFDQMWSQETREGLMVELNFSAQGGSSSGRKEVKIESVELLPIIIENYCCPRPADSAEKQKILEKINASSTIFIRD